MTAAAETLSDRIRQVRGAQSQAEFASRLAVHKETLGKYERNQRPPDTDFLALVAAEYGVDLNWLVTGQARVTANDQVQGSQADLGEALLGVVLDEVAGVLEAQKLRPTPAEQARLTKAVYKVVRRRMAEDGQVEPSRHYTRNVVVDLLSVIG